MVGILVSFWDCLFSGAMLVSGRVVLLFHPKKQIGKSFRYSHGIPSPGVSRGTAALYGARNLVVLGRWEQHLGWLFFVYNASDVNKKLLLFVRVQLQETEMKRCKHRVTWWWIQTIWFFNPYLRTEDPHTLQHCSSTFKGGFWLSTHGCYSKQGVGPRIIGKPQLSIVCHFGNLCCFWQERCFAEPPGNTKGSAQWRTIDLQEGRGNTVGWDHITSQMPEAWVASVSSIWLATVVMLSG